MAETELQSPNGTLEGTFLSQDEERFVANLLAIPEVCSLFTDPVDKQIAAIIQAKCSSS